MTARRNTRLLGIGMLALGLGLALNTLLGPLGLAVIDYPFTETVRNETLGLEAVSLLLVAPIAIGAAVLSLRGHPAAPLIAVGPAAYATYMLVQYIVGPQYPSYQPSIALHLALFVLSLSLLLHAWTRAEAPLPGHSRVWSAICFGLAAFVLFRWLPAFGGMIAGEPIAAAPPDVTMYWSIFFLDLGLVVPAAVATGVGLLIGHPWATKALYGVVGWFALVPPSVAAMSIVKVLRADPHAVAADALVFIAVTLIFWLIAFRLFRRLIKGSTVEMNRQVTQNPISAATRGWGTDGV